MKNTVIYHSADFDGIFCREIAKKFLGTDGVEYIGWNFGDPKVQYPIEGAIYVLDLSPECLEIPDRVVNAFDRIRWIDHHKTSIEKWPQDISGYRIDGVAACRLAWQWFTRKGDVGSAPGSFPMKEHYVNREVVEPLAVRLAGEYDVWDKRDPRAETFQYGLRSETLDDECWRMLLCDDDFAESIVGMGEYAQCYAKNVDASICNSLTWLMDWEGLKWLCVNHARFNSNLFAARDVPETGHDALLGFRFDGKSWMVSLYHAKHRTDLDLSQIAVKHGGGGHRGACGFTCHRLPWL